MKEAQHLPMLQTLLPQPLRKLFRADECFRSD